MLLLLRCLSLALCLYQEEDSSGLVSDAAELTEHNLTNGVFRTYF